MRPLELLLAGLVYAIAAFAAALILRGLDAGEAGLAMVVGAATGSFTAAFAYHRRVRDERAGFRVKAAAGAALAVAALAVGAGFEALWSWMTYPAITIGGAMIGSAVFPFVLFETARRALPGPRQAL